MNSGDQTTPRLCAHCEYDLAGLPSPVCPECGKEQPKPNPKPKRLVRPGKAWIGVSLVGAMTFGVLTMLSVLVGTELGIAYTGDQELVGFTFAFAVVTGAYAILAFELWWHRGSLPSVESNDLWIMGVTICIGGPLLTFMVLALVAVLR